MIRKKYVSTMANLELKNKLNLVVIGILAFLVFILGINLVSASKQNTVVIIPQGLGQTVTVGNSTASEQYLMAMGNYVTFLFLNFDEKTVVSQYDTLSGLSSNLVRTEAVMLAEDYRKSHISSRAIIQRMEVTDQSITVFGRRTKFIMDRSVEETNFTLVIRYSITFGTFRVDELRFS